VVLLLLFLYLCAWSCVYVDLTVSHMRSDVLTHGCVVHELQLAFICHHEP
jgi:hypothetical protein